MEEGKMTEVITRQDEIELINTIYQELKQQDPYLSKHTMQLMIWEELENRLGMCFINYFSHGDGYQVWRDYPTKSSNMITEVTKNHFAKLTLERKKKLIESNKVARRWKKLKSNQEAGKSLDKNELENLVYGDKNSSSSDDKVSKPNISIGEGKALLENTAEDKKKGGGGEEGVIDDPMFGGLTGRHTTILTDYAEIVKPMRALWKALTQKSVCHI
jgi:hypothetical protein